MTSNAPSPRSSPSSVTEMRVSSAGAIRPSRLARLMARRRLPGMALRAGVAALVLGVLGAVVPAGQSLARPVVAVQANVGNINVGGCRVQVYKLCLRPVERRAAAALRAL